ncbi:50S ribosomal protein L30 [Quillaja saponaria]|uniref:Large ribosomal subunit protein uL30m n=1 Tax=Quillaja saponaria TaxID=32244 RepID=A0AAD7PLU2_QUISA|nr:50S ribosomal protein L30 [Quillaja saponaria]
MNAFKAYKACVPIAWSPNLYITLVRGIPGTRKLHRRTLEALRLRKCNRTVMRWNTPTVRGMLQQIKRLVVIETEEMFKARKHKEANHQAIRPPLVINHLPRLLPGLLNSLRDDVRLLAQPQRQINWGPTTFSLYGTYLDLSQKSFIIPVIIYPVLSKTI